MNIPYGRISSTLGASLKYMRPAAWHMAGGAVAGAAASYASGDGSMLRDAAIGAGVGLGYRRGWGPKFMSSGRAGAGAGNFNVGNAFQGVWNREKTILGRMAGR